VLPFDNIGGNPQEAFLANGLHQDMISVLSRLYGDQLGVIGSTASKRYSGASMDRFAKELKVDYIVEGGVQREGGKAHITARLVRAKDYIQVWNGTFDRDLGEIVAAQSEIAQQVGRGIERGLRPDGRVSAALARPLDAAAHEAYLRGDFAKAIKLDPGYAAAYTGLANQLYYPGLFGFAPPQGAFPRMRDAAAKAIELDATQSSAHATFGLGKLHLQWRWAEAEDGFQQALKLNPSDANVRHLYAHTLLWRRRDRESADEMEKALDLDPFEPTIFPCVGWHELLAGREDKALDANRHAFGLDPDNWWASLTTGWAYEQKGMYQEALSSLRKSFNCNLKTASIAHVFGRSGNRSGAKTIVEELLAQAKTKYVSPYDIAVVYAGLDDKGAAFEWLSRAYEERAGFLVFVKQDPRFKTLRQEPQFGDLVRRLGYSKA
jgi:TolB-like protein/Flp pilus assembly protein TadD